MRIYYNQPEGMVLALRMHLDEQGKVSLEPGDDHVDAAMRAVSGGVVSYAPFRVLTPNDGEDYLMAVYSMLLHSSYWLPFADQDETRKMGSRGGRKKVKAKPDTPAVARPRAPRARQPKSD